MIPGPVRDRSQTREGKRKVVGTDLPRGWIDRWTRDKRTRQHTEGGDQTNQKRGRGRKEGKIKTEKGRERKSLQVRTETYCRTRRIRMGVQGDGVNTTLLSDAR